MGNSDDETPTASQEGHHKCVALLLQHGAKVNRADIHKFTALSVASERGQEKCAKLLLKHGNIGINARDKYNKTALFMACQDGHHNYVAILLQYGADANWPIYTMLRNY